MIHELMVNLQKDMNSLSAPLSRRPTWQERQPTFTEAWTTGRENIFNEFVY